MICKKEKEKRDRSCLGLSFQKVSGNYELHYLVCTLQYSMNTAVAKQLLYTKVLKEKKIG